MAEEKRPIAYSRPPLETVDGIPVFCDADRYVENYIKIAHDHVESMKPGADNPFIPNELWDLLDESTREILRRHLTAGQSILDVGVGLGRVLGPLIHLDRYGIDISREYLCQSRAAGISVAYARVESLPYPDNSFDAIVTCDVLEHVLDLNRACEEMLRVLKPGGLLVVRVPNKEDLEVYLRKDLPYEFIHLRAFDLAGFRLLMEKVFGLEFVEGAEVGHHLQGSPRLRLRLLPERHRTAAAAVARENRLAFWRVGWMFWISEERFEKWIYSLKRRVPAVFKAIAPSLVLGIEFNAVFRNPAAKPEGK